MLFQQKYIIAESQKGLLYKDKKFIKVLDAGVYRFWSAGKNYELKLVETAAWNREITSEEILLVVESHVAEFTQHVDLWETSAEEIGLIFEQETLRDIKLPSQRGAFWKGVREIRVDKINISTNFSITQRMAALMLGAENVKLRQSATNAIFAVTVPEGHVGFLEIDGKVTETLKTGTYAWWKFSRVLKTKLFDMRLQNMEING
nr:hypothetical protein [Betaproteobacteria bacterium]